MATSEQNKRRALTWSSMFVKHITKKDMDLIMPVIAKATGILKPSYDDVVVFLIEVYKLHIKKE